MAEDRYERDNREGRYGERSRYGRGERDTGGYQSEPAGSLSDRSRPYGSSGRSGYGEDRQDWTTNDLGYSDRGQDYRPYRSRAWDDRYGNQGDYGYGEKRGFVDRASDEVASWFGDDSARRRRENDQFRGKGPRGYTRSDTRIEEDVNDRLSDDPFLDASDIEVSVSGGEVTLSGNVANRQDKRRAEDCVESISGVSNVQNNLRITGNTTGASTATSAL